MTKKMLMNISLVALSAMLLLGAVLAVCILTASGDDRVIDVEVSDGKTESVEFKGLALVPGGEAVYTLKLSGERAEKYSVTLKFTPDDGEQALAEYAYVRIEAGSEVICDDALARVLDGEEMYISVDFSENANNDITVTYYLPQSVGNEAQNAAATFELLICASNE